MSDFLKILLNKSRHWLIIAFLFAVPLYQSRTIPAREAQEAFFQYGAICILAFFIGNFWIGAFIVWNVILYVLAGAQVGSMQVLNITFGSALFMFSRFYFKSNRFSDYYKPILWLSVITICFMSLQLFGIDPVFRGAINGGGVLDSGFSDPVGIFCIKMANGIFLMCALPMVAAVSPLLAPLFFIPIYLSESSSVGLALAIVTLFYVYHQHRIIIVRGLKIPLFLILLIALPITGGLYIAKDLKHDPLTFKSRFPSWHMAVHMAFNEPITGYGPDSFRNLNNLKRFRLRTDGLYRPMIQQEIDANNSAFKFYSPTNNDLEVMDMTAEVLRNGGFPEGLPRNNKGNVEINLWDNPHNLFINVFFQYGLVGLLLLFGLLREMYFRFKHSIKDKELVVLASIILVFLISSLTHFPLELARTAYIFPLVLGAFYAETDLKDA